MPPRLRRHPGSVGSGNVNSLLLRELLVGTERASRSEAHNSSGRPSHSCTCHESADCPCGYGRVFHTLLETLLEGLVLRRVFRVLLKVHLFSLGLPLHRGGRANTKCAGSYSTVSR